MGVDRARLGADAGAPERRRCEGGPIPLNPDLERLIALQKLDSAAHDAQRRLAEGPEREKASAARLDASRQILAVAKQHLTENQNARRALEKDVALQQGRLSKFRDQLMEVKTNREYQAMQHEIETAQNGVKMAEEKVLERMLEADELTAIVKKAEAEVAAEQKTMDADRAALTAETVELTAALERMAAERLTLVASMDKKALAMFEQVARRRNGVAVAEARDGICTICHVRLRPQVFNSVRRNDAIIQCDTCNRILYFVQAPSAPATADSVSQTTP
jgi:predicted  nucleic acid-binding Zn-ribbon protein